MSDLSMPFRAEVRGKIDEFIDRFFPTLRPEMIDLHITSMVSTLGRAHNSRYGVAMTRPNLYRVDITHHLDSLYGDSKAINSRWSVLDTVIIHELIHIEQYAKRSHIGKFEPHGGAFLNRLHALGGPRTAWTDSIDMYLEAYLWKCNHCPCRIVSSKRWNKRRGCPNHKSFVYLVPAYMDRKTQQREFLDQRPTPMRYVPKDVLQEWIDGKVETDAVRIASARSVLDKILREKARMGRVSVSSANLSDVLNS